MPTTKNRLNVTLPEKFESILNLAAEESNIPKSAKLLQWAKMGAELEEDYTLAQIAEERKIKCDGKFLTHEKIWGETV